MQYETQAIEHNQWFGNYTALLATHGELWLAHTQLLGNHTVAITQLALCRLGGQLWD
jgi:hypothetical protein